MRNIEYINSSKPLKIVDTPRFAAVLSEMKCDFLVLECPDDLSARPQLWEFAQRWVRSCEPMEILLLFIEILPLADSHFKNLFGLTWNPIRDGSVVTVSSPEEGIAGAMHDVVGMALATQAALDRAVWRRLGSLDITPVHIG